MSIDWAQSLLQQIAHISIEKVALLFALFGVGQIVIPPFPGDVILFFGGSVWPGGYWSNFLPLLVSYWVGTTIASLLMYELGAHFGCKIFSWKWVCRFFPEKTQTIVTQWLNEKGAATIFTAKFIAGLNVPMLILSGALGYERKKCYPIIILTAAVYNTLFYSLGSLLGDNWNAVADFCSRYQILLYILLGVVILLILLYRSLKDRHKA